MTQCRWCNNCRRWLLVGVGIFDVVVVIVDAFTAIARFSLMLSLSRYRDLKKTNRIVVVVVIFVTVNDVVAIFIPSVTVAVVAVVVICVA